MAKLSPAQEVKQRFGSKEKLAEELLPVLERDDDVDDAEFERRVKTASNRQLLRLHRVHEIVKHRFGSKEKLVDALVAKQFPKGNDPYRTKLLKLRPTRLLDLYRSAS